MKRISVKIFVLISLVMLMSACKSSSKLDAKDQLTVSAWELNTLQGKTVDGREFMNGMPFLVFSKDGRLSGSTGCNSMSGTYELKNNNISLNPGAMTRMACPGNGEMLFLEAMRKVKNLEIAGGKLVLQDGTTEIMTLVPRK
jgi:heat shock protein HslJ